MIFTISAQRNSIGDGKFEFHQLKYEFQITDKRKDRKQDERFLRECVRSRAEIVRAGSRFARSADEAFMGKGWGNLATVGQRQDVQTETYHFLSSLSARACTQTHSLLELGAYSSAATHRLYPSTVIVFRLDSTKDSLFDFGWRATVVYRAWRYTKIGTIQSGETSGISSCDLPPVSPSDCVKLRVHYYHVASFVSSLKPGNASQNAVIGSNE